MKIFKINHFKKWIEIEIGLSEEEKKKQKNKAFKKLVLEYVCRKTKPQEYGKEYRKNQYENMPE